MATCLTCAHRGREFQSKSDAASFNSDSMIHSHSGLVTCLRRSRLLPVPVRENGQKHLSIAITVKTQDTLHVLENEWVSQVSHIPGDNAQVTEKGKKT